MKTTYLYIGLIVLVIVGLIVVRNGTGGGAGGRTATVYDGFAQCLTDAGAKFYGAYWCAHCQAQKKLFANSKMLPYIECSTADGKSQTQICIDEKITGYPTWKFADGSVLNGEHSLEELGAKTNCAVPSV